MLQDCPLAEGGGPRWGDSYSRGCQKLDSDRQRESDPVMIFPLCFDPVCCCLLLFVVCCCLFLFVACCSSFDLVVLVLVVIVSSFIFSLMFFKPVNLLSR